MKLYLDPGHGGSDPGAQGNGFREKDLNLDIALKIRSILENNYENIDVRMSRTSDVTKSLDQRTNEANSWEADFYLSIHINSFNGSAQGYEDYIHSSLSNNSATSRYRDIIHTEVMKLNQLDDRGKKKADFHVLRETTMDAMLSENGFIDNAQNAALMKQESWRRNVAQGHANGIAKAFNLTPKEATDRGALYKVIAGSFKQRENAEKRVTDLDAQGYDSFISTSEVSGETWYRVQAGAFSSRENAETRLQEIESKGIDAFIAID
ncbi:N-acetylmuramoyl-L-alanine amidase [Mesobacillus selenatarsenatis]|uniref:N-acetylmuramoyl-L-alanine amidase n=1 Tax=Mesobacillus selenatarsenatis (strain DSM 18680 / JCM 14380 / FERM P-15431 / SF-1) TaxID=1321606 RepID=A0A0A8X4G7_MESS1|nr:N-acetylmuramoyl-L-alanine amidase [Mesobacillus selenatarsenatis]GAM13031.1 N-acetylmuramoyl-L-alanine amidase [Mesobacillus selenatarsenatis SF-1]